VNSNLFRNAVVVLTGIIAATPGAAQVSPNAILAGRLLGPSGQLEKTMTIHLAHGKIKSVQPGHRYKAGQVVVRHENAVVFPGLIDVRSRLGTFGITNETSRAIDPSVSAVDLVDLAHRDFARAMQAGVTTVMVAPAENNLVSGAALVVKTTSRRGRDPILRSDGPLMMALGSTVWQYDRAPTSRIGSMSMMREAMAEAVAGRGPLRLREFFAGKLDGIVVCETMEDIRSAVGLFAGTPVRFSLVHSSDIQDASVLSGQRSQAMIVGPYGFDTPPGSLLQAGAFARAGVPVVIAGDTPARPFESLRIGANLAVRYGMDAAAARLAITTAAARVAGVSGRVGAIRPGLDADLVVFSDDPLRLDARVLEVYVDGVRVYQDMSAAE